MSTEYDVVVIGAGPAGETAAGRAANGDLAVAIVEAELVGGECSYWGCIPSKTLIRPGDVLAAARRVPGAAEAITGRVDVASALARRDYMTSNWTDSGQLAWLKDHGIVLIRGLGRIAGELTVEVESSDHSVRHLTARRAVVLATGTSAAIPSVEGLRDLKPWDNRDVATDDAPLPSVPRRLLVLGGSSIGAEMAQAFKRLGCEEVTIIEALERLLSREEPFAGDEVRMAFEAEDIVVLTGCEMTAAKRAGSDGPVVATLAIVGGVDLDRLAHGVLSFPTLSEVWLKLFEAYGL